jgi:hypothetical protein
VSRRRAALPLPVGLALPRPADLALPLLLGLALFGCRTALVRWTPLAAGDPRPALRVAALQELAEQRHALRATGRVRTEGPAGTGFSKQLLLVERPARLRVEVVGLLEQRVLVLATDGEQYELYRGQTAGFETGEVHPGVLDEVAGLPLTPDAAASLLLAAPLAPAEPPEAAREDETGALSLAWPDQTLEFDAEGRLAALLFHPGGRDVLRARWGEWREVAGGAFPHRLELELYRPEARWQLDYREVELNPRIPPELFRLRPRGR